MSEVRKVGFLHGVGIFFVPYIFVWPLLRSGYGSRARKLSFGWLAILLIANVVSVLSKSTSTSTQVKQVAVTQDKVLASSNSKVGKMAEEPAVEAYYVIVDRAQVRLSPDENGKITNTLFIRQKVDVLEKKNGWARVSRFYDGNVEGVVGQVARWVSFRQLSTVRPPDEKLAPSSSDLEKALAGSDDFGRYRNQFLKAAQGLVEKGKCTVEDFQRQGGWFKSTNHESQPVYFTYCGEMNRDNRIYFNAKTGAIFK